MAVMSLERGLSVLEGRAQVARVFLWLYMASGALLTISIAAIAAAGLRSGHPAHLAIAFSGMAFAVVAFIGFIVNGMWIYRAHANLFAAGFEGLEFSPGWSVGWFFVPIASLFKPFQAMRELWNVSHLQSDGYTAPADPQVTAWWTLWVGGSIAINVGTRLSEAMGSSGFVVILALGFVLFIASGWFFLQIVNAVTRAQLSEMEAAYAFA